MEEVLPGVEIAIDGFEVIRLFPLLVLVVKGKEFVASTDPELLPLVAMEAPFKEEKTVSLSETLVTVDVPSNVPV